VAKVSDGELVELIEGALDRYVSARSINLDNLRRSVAESIVGALHDAGATVIREQRRRRLSEAQTHTLQRLRDELFA
jgi:hypothetical protein